MHDLLYVRLCIALVWLYQGLWLKVLARERRHGEIVGSVPFLGATQARAALVILGLVETAIGLWVITGRSAVEVAFVQTFLLIAMNGSGLLWAKRLIPDPAGMVVQNVAFLMLVWVAAGKVGAYGAY